MASAIIYVKMSPVTLSEEDRALSRWLFEYRHKSLCLFAWFPTQLN